MLISAWWKVGYIFWYEKLSDTASLALNVFCKDISDRICQWVKPASDTFFVILTWWLLMSTSLTENFFFWNVYKWRYMWPYSGTAKCFSVYFSPFTLLNANNCSATPVPFKHTFLVWVQKLLTYWFIITSRVLYILYIVYVYQHRNRNKLLMNGIPLCMADGTVFIQAHLFLFFYQRWLSFGCWVGLNNPKWHRDRNKSGFSRCG